MKRIPSIDSFFDLEKALKEDGFKIDEKDMGTCIAYGFSYEDYGEIWIEFNQAFINNYPINMRVFCIKDQKNLFKGVAPTNQHDYEMLMQLLFPSKEYIDRIEAHLNEQEKLASFV